MNAASEGPEALPAGLRQDWPVAWQPVWGRKDSPWRKLLSAAAHGLLAATARTPEPLLARTIDLVARSARLLLRERSDTARDFLRQALGSGLAESELERHVLQAWRHFLRVLVDSERFPRLVPFERIREHFDIRWTEEARRIRDSGAGCVLISAHVGNWEAASAAAPWIGFDPLYVVAKPISNRPFSKIVQRARERRGIRLLPRRGAMNDAPRVIHAGGAIGMLLDQRANVRPILVPFFGRPARCDRSAGILLRRTKAPVLVFACYMTAKPLHYRVEFFDSLWPEDLARARPEDLATRINQAFERMILAHPEQYFWLHDRYRDTPGSFSDEEKASDPPLDAGRQGRDGSGRKHSLAESPGVD